MKFGQLIEYNMRNIFLEKLCPKCGRKLSINSHWMNNVKHSKVFLLYVQIELYQYILILTC